MIEYCGLARMAVSAGGQVSSMERKDISIRGKGVSIGSEGGSIESDDVMLVECLVKMFGGVIWNKERRKEEQSEMKYLYVG